jgi:TetR/AcrR family transcriptional regulator, mexCD-oprJ operon repressor
MIRALSTQEKRSGTLRAIAERFWIDPNASIAVLADAAGLSRRTLYRIAATRGDLIRLLHQEAVLATRRAMQDAGVEQGPWRDALGLLVERFVLEGPIYAFWVIGAEGNPDFEAELRHYRAVMIAFFERAQDEGGLSRQHTALWMLEAFDGLLLASLSARRNQSAPVGDLPALVLDAFIRAFGA